VSPRCAYKFGTKNIMSMFEQKAFRRTRRIIILTGSVGAIGQQIAPWIGGLNRSVFNPDKGAGRPWGLSAISRSIGGKEEGVVRRFCDIKFPGPSGHSFYFIARRRKYWP
jgi:hypothetical protein